MNCSLPSSNIRSERNSSTSTNGASAICYCGTIAALRMRDAAPLLEAGAEVTVTEHGEPFAAAVESGVLSAAQFHPEKSGDAGAVVLSNWLATL